MKTIVVIYWSGTGNTQMMADAVAKGAAAEGVAVNVILAGNANVKNVLEADAVAMGCPAMGNEVLEETEMEPFISLLEQEDISSKPMVLFGSYDWGDGQWMHEWEQRMRAQGVQMIDEGFIVQNAPDKSALTKCRELGEKLAAAIA